MVRFDVHRVEKATLSYEDFPGDAVMPTFRTLRIIVDTEEGQHVITLFTRDMELTFIAASKGGAK